jgi:spore germination cell wall hydrolase CwlJ-like protein
MLSLIYLALSDNYKEIIMKLKQGILSIIVGTFIALPLGMAERTLNTAYQTVKATKSEILCLAKNIYYEARGEPVRGKIAVAQVTLNRVTHRTEFDASICQVVYAKRQFSWTDERVREPRGEAWLEAQALAKLVVQGVAYLPNFKGLYFHNTTVNPSWNRTKNLIAKIGNHIFYA